MNFPNDDVLLTSRDVRRIRGGCSEMTIWRDVRRGTLPPPKKLNGRNHWRRSVVLRAYGLDGTDETNADTAA